MKNNPQSRQKSKSRWLIPAGIAFILVFVVVQLFLLDETRHQSIAQEKVSEEVNIVASPIDEYIVFVRENKPQENSLFVGGYLSGALEHLTIALKELSRQEAVSLDKEAFSKLKEQSERIANAPRNEKAALVNDFFVLVAQNLESLNLKGSEQINKEINMLQEKLHALNDKHTVENQEEAISQFLKQTGIVLELIENEA